MHPKYFLLQFSQSDTKNSDFFPFKNLSVFQFQFISAKFSIKNVQYEIHFLEKAPVFIVMSVFVALTEKHEQLYFKNMLWFFSRKVHY